MKWWFKRHPKLLESELNGICQNSNFEVAHVARNNLLTVSGNVLIRGKNLRRFPVLIVYTHATPYSLPQIYPLVELLEEEVLEGISQLELGPSLFELIEPNIRFFNLRHQNPDGSICLFELDSLGDNTPTIIGSRFYLKRLRDWFSGLQTGRFPPDSLEVELFAHFKYQVDDLEIFYSDIFSHKNLIQGEFYNSVRQHFWGDLEYQTTRFLRGKNQLGIYMGYSTDFFVTGQIPDLGSEQDFLKNRDEVEKAIDEGRLNHGFWWHIDSVPNPFSSFEELAFLLGNGDKNKGYIRMYDLLAVTVRFGRPDQLFALRFPNKKGELEVQFFHVNRIRSKAFATTLEQVNFEKELKSGDLDHIPTVGEDYSIEQFVHTLNTQYEPIYAIYSEEISERKHHLRNSGRVDRHQLKSKEISIVGCGALGGEIADSLAKAGVGRIRLIDKEVYRVRNAIRHVLPQEYSGFPKPDALRMKLLSHNPFVYVTAESGNVLMADINLYIGANGIGISSLADDNVEGFINEQAIINRKTIFYVRALRGGKAGRIFRVVPGYDACFNCLSIYRNTKDERFPVIIQDESLPSITNECNNPIRPGSAADLKIISALGSRLILEFLHTSNGSKANHWVWQAEDMDDFVTNPWQLSSTWLPPHPNCKYCRQSDPISISVLREALEFMKSETLKDQGKETGGILVGTKDEKGNIVITNASGPGPKAKKTTTYFEKDDKYCQSFVDLHFKEGKNEIRYVGEWHSHPTNSLTPSPIDLFSLQNIANSYNYLTDKPIMIIFSAQGKYNCTVHPVERSFYSTPLKVIDDLQ